MSRHEPFDAAVPGRVIAAHLIFGDLPEPFLEAAVRSVNWVDMMIAVNTAPGSQIASDHINAISRAREHRGLSVVATDGELDFAAARNLALRHTSDGAFCLVLDSDDVHFPEFEGIVGYYLAQGADSITAAFYHMVVYRDAYQAVFPREIVFRKTPETMWTGRVHEQLHTTRRSAVTADYRYMHYGYMKPQPQVFDRWVRYSEIEGEPHHYAGQDPENIISDRVSVATRFALDHPPAMADLIEQFPVCPVPLDGEPEPAAPKVGFVLLARGGDAPLLRQMLDSLRPTHGQMTVAAMNVSETDEPGRQEVATVLAEAQSEQFAWGRLTLLQDAPGASLVRALNAGIKHFREQGFDYIGWIHPDMRFEDPGWLGGLLHELQCWPRVGKVCAANTRDPIPAEMIPGHEQCFLMRRSVLDEVGLFDSGFVGIGGYEDWDLNRRVLNAGHRVVITPRALVFHEGMATRSRRDTTAEQRANAAYYESKWGSRDAPV